MGHVFTPKDFIADRIPNLEDYKKAINLLRTDLLELSKEGTIYGANIHGSNFHNDGGIGSDLDVLVITDSSEAEEILNKLNTKIKDLTRVPVDFVPISRLIAETKNHSLGKLYVKYLQDFCKEGIIGNNPLSVIAPKDSWENLEEEISNRFSSQLEKLSKQKIGLRDDFSQEHCDFLEKILRQPIYAAIDMVRLNHDGSYPSENGRPLSKREILEIYKREFPQMKFISQDFNKILEKRKEYRYSLNTKEMNPGEYFGLLGEIGELYPNAKRIIEANLRFLNSNKQ